MTDEQAQVVICGAGIAGVSAAYALTVEHGLRKVVLVDELPPLSLTSDHSTECYRNWWPGPDDAMVALMNRSIDRLEELARRYGNFFHLNRRGYLYCTADPQRAQQMEQEAAQVAALGAGPLRVHHRGETSTYRPPAAQGFEDAPEGADLLLNSSLIKEHFPYLSPRICAVLHVRRAGWFSAQQLGMFLLQESRAHGARFVQARLVGVERCAGRVSAVVLGDGRVIRTSNLVIAAGPYSAEVARMMGVELPLSNELHLKAALPDSQQTLPRHAPLVILSDPQRLTWSDEERYALESDPDCHYLLDELPPGLHTRPEGGRESCVILALWELRPRLMEPIFPIPEDPLYPHVLWRGLPALIPAMEAYLHKAGRPRLDGGYYTRTPENRPVIGPLSVEGAFLIGALSGFGIMAAMAAGELLAAHVMDSPRPAYAFHFALERYRDPTYMASVEAWGRIGQL